MKRPQRLGEGPPIHYFLEGLHSAEGDGGRDLALLKMLSLEILWMLLITILFWNGLCSASIYFEISQVLHIFSFESDRCTSGNRFWSECAALTAIQKRIVFTCYFKNHLQFRLILVPCLLEPTIETTLVSQAFAVEYNEHLGKSQSININYVLLITFIKPYLNKMNEK